MESDLFLRGVILAHKAEEFAGDSHKDRQLGQAKIAKDPARRKTGTAFVALAWNVTLLVSPETGTELLGVFAWRNLPGV